MFCDDFCRSEGLKRFHAFECEFVDQLHLGGSRETGRKKFDPFDMLRALTESLVSEISEKSPSDLKKLPSNPLPDHHATCRPRLSAQTVDAAG
jgi:hypothetical protein